MHRKHMRHKDNETGKNRSSSLRNSGYHEDGDSTDSSSSNEFISQNILKSSQQFPDWHEALNKVATALNNNNLNYKLSGSGAYVLHGAVYESAEDFPDDIDITTSDLKSARESLLKAGFTESEDSTDAVNKFKCGSILIDVTSDEDFGLKHAKTIVRENICVTSLLETLLSNYLRPERRAKDKKAFDSLIENNKDELKKLLKSESIQSQYGKQGNFLGKIESKLAAIKSALNSSQSVYVPSSRSNKSSSAQSSSSRSSISVSRDDIATTTNSTALIQAVVSDDKNTNTDNSSSRHPSSSSSKSQSENNSSEDRYDDSDSVKFPERAKSNSISSIVRNKIARFFNRNPWVKDVLTGLAIGFAISAFVVACVASGGAIFGAATGIGALAGTALFISSLVTIGGSIGGTIGIFGGITAAATAFHTGLSALFRNCFPKKPHQKPDRNDIGIATLASVKESAHEEHGKPTAFKPQNSDSNYVKNSLLARSEKVIVSDKTNDAQPTITQESRS